MNTTNDWVDTVVNNMSKYSETNSLVFDTTVSSEIFNDSTSTQISEPFKSKVDWDTKTNKQKQNIRRNKRKLTKNIKVIVVIFL